MIKYKDEDGKWVEWKLEASNIVTKKGLTVQKELENNAESIKQLSVNGGNAGYVTSSSGIKFKLGVTDSGQLYTIPMKIPRVDIIGSLNGIGKDKPVWAEIKYDGEKTFHKKVQMEWQGNTSIGFPKKNFSIDLYEMDGETECPMNFRDWPSTDGFHLKANWIDATHARNVLNARLAKQIFPSVPMGGRGVIDGFPVELYMNGSFYGIYTWNLKQNKDLFQMSKKNENHLVYRSDYHDGSGAFSNWTNDDIHRVWRNKVPKKITQHTKLARMIQWVGTSPNEDFKRDISKYLNLDACINYYIMLDLLYLPDNVCKNMTLATWDGNVWYPLFYDIDCSWGLHWNGGSTYQPTTALDLKGSKLWTKLVVNFESEIKSRYVELRRTTFSKTNIMNEFQTFANSIGDANYKKDQDKWPDIPSKTYGIPFIKNWINDRFKYIDQKYGVTLDD